MRLLVAAFLCGLTVASAQDTFSGAAALDAAIEDAIQKDELPGAVLLIGHKGKIIHRKAYGLRALTPEREPMTVDTIFDIASLTKVVATTPALMKLFEEGKLRLNDRVTRYLPEFQGGDSPITVRMLMTHFSGMRGDLDLEPPWNGYQTGIEKALIDKPVAAPGDSFIYSDINFILLCEIVHRLSGKMLPDYAREVVFEPLEMRETMFQPPRDLRPRIAPTEQLPHSRVPLRGIVHDDTTRYMGGIAGHAGVFSTADDLAVFAEMMLGMGERNGVRIFSPPTVRKFTSPQSPPDQPVLRGLGWDIDSVYSGNRGELFSVGSYGHTGFTGTSIWIDPATESYVILLANSVHPQRRPAITSLRSRIATITAAALGMEVPGIDITGYNETVVRAGTRRVTQRNGQILTGLDVLAEQHFEPLQGKRIGLITNHTGLSRDGRRNVDLMVEAGVNVTVLLAPEHGIGGSEDTENIANSVDPATGIPVWSLYQGANRRPREEMLRDVDALVFDIQDVGARFYTYISTMGQALEEAAKRGIPFFVLDRPNPITGVHVEGPVLENELQSFVGYFPLPLRHGMTVGELAGLFNKENRLGAELHVVPMKNWERGDWFDSTGLTWVNPSPNLRGLNAALLYPGVAMLEASANYSVGRGTDAPFEQVGADWIKGRELAVYLNSRHIPGVSFYATRFRPVSSQFAGISIEGVRFVVIEREAFNSSLLGLEIAGALRKFYPEKMSLDANRHLIGNNQVIEGLRTSQDPRQVFQEMHTLVEEFLGLREKYLIYR